MRPNTSVLNGRSASASCGIVSAAHSANIGELLMICPPALGNGLNDCRGSNSTEYFTLSRAPPLAPRVRGTDRAAARSVPQLPAIVPPPPAPTCLLRRPVERRRLSASGVGHGQCCRLEPNGQRGSPWPELHGHYASRSGGQGCLPEELTITSGATGRKEPDDGVVRRTCR